MDSNAIKWSQNPKEKTLLSDHIIQEFERYFKGEYIRPQCITRDMQYLYDFLTDLTKQELDIFLKLKANIAKGYTDKNFTEILLHCIERTGSLAKGPLLIALNYILTKNEPAKDIVIQNIEVIEKIANSDNKNLNGIARAIIEKINYPYHPKTETQYVFDRKEEYEFYRQLRQLLTRARSTIKFWDNYANHEIIDLIHSNTSKIHLKNVKILFKKKSHKEDLELAKNKFIKQYPNILLEIKESTRSHDRFLIIDNEIWGLGPSAKDGGEGACFITQLKDAAAIKFVEIFDDEWKKAGSI